MKEETVNEAIDRMYQDLDGLNESALLVGYIERIVRYAEALSGGTPQDVIDACFLPLELTAYLRRLEETKLWTEAKLPHAEQNQ